MYNERDELYREEIKAEMDNAMRHANLATHPGRLGDHLLGGTAGAMIGAAAGGAVAGAMQGMAAGIPGMLAGVAIGTVAGALAGKGAAQIINPTTEDEQWSETLFYNSSNSNTKFSHKDVA